jgi:hypothetical protein
MFRARHLHEERLFECYLAEHAGEPMEPPAAEHLADCAECAARYADLRRFMEGLRSEADHELDEVFPAERLRVQQQQIARRIDHMGHAARIISFPGRVPDRPAPATRSRVARRWLAGAAAAGLMMGVGLGSFLYRDAPAPEAETVPASAIFGPAEPPIVRTRAPEVVNDLDFLSELEIALERPNTPELLALDELTPHVREVRISRASW